MKQLKYILPLFAIMVAAQIYVPSQMIWHNENIISNGKEFHFRTAPIDPNDPFRGKYITLSYMDDEAIVPNIDNLEYDQTVYVSFDVDEDGYAYPSAVNALMPASDEYHLKTTIDYLSPNAFGENIVAIEYPFNRFYMEESKAYEAEKFYMNANRDTAQEAYAVVFIRNGEAVVEDVMIDGVSIVDLVTD